MTDRSEPHGGPGEHPGQDLDPTQPVPTPWFTPKPEHRPDPGWAGWGPQQAATSPERWFEPTHPGGAAVAGGAGHAAPTTVTTGAAQPVRARRGSSVGPVVAASLLSAVLASGGTVLVLDRTGALDAAPVASQAPGQTVGAQAPVTIDESSAIINAADRVGPAVVRIQTSTGGGAFDPFGDVPTNGIGSGVIYDADGWIVTNRHVVAGSERLTVELKDGRQFPGRVYGIDTLTDLAIVKVDAADLVPASVGSSDGLKIGQLVVAVGSPLGTYTFSVTSGIVSGTGRSITVDGGTRLTNLIQTDAAINPGNSGGPLVDAAGNVVGINTAVATNANGIGFAIPIDIARPIMEQAVRGEELARPWIGIRFESIDLQLKERLGLPVEDGALVGAGGTDEAVVAGSPAAEAGVREGDIIRSIGGQVIDDEHPLDALLVQFAPGDTVTLEILRDGETVEIEVTLGTRPADL
ncbi:MAG TPA: trypsin-like peptidase domain-containing protein [Candidatus Limnocylindrales bacterium]|nr:trypsin-like peptidase domain-containing protein [Candidatus Limnocylindrales bacterium]